MGERTGISWCDHTWNPWQGCHKVSAGCINCYMFREKKRFGQDPNVVIRSKPTTFRMPLKSPKWRDPAKVFTCSWSDWFVEEADAWRDEAWEIIRATPWLTYQILTKRPERIAGHLPADWGWGWHNVWLGVTAENQAMADERIPLLLETPAAVRFVSIEPMLGPIRLPVILLQNHLGHFLTTPGSHGETWVHDDETHLDWSCYDMPITSVDWIIVGGESGPGARPLHPDWVRGLRDQCVAADVPFFFKAWGQYGPRHGDGGMVWLGPRQQGRRLDGREWLQFPEPR